MRSFFRLRIAGSLTIALSFAASLSAQAEEPKAAPIDFERQVRPILAENCFACHGPDEGKRESGLRLDTREGLFTPRDGVAPVLPGKTDTGLLLARIASADDSERMPPAESGKTLTNAQVDLLRRWIAEGAVWKQHWAYVPPTRPRVPASSSQVSRRGAIDAFILAKLQAERLSPALPADRTTLLRRLYLDVLGLPPAVAEIDAFLADSAPDAYERRVDRVLASPGFGERMAMDWLDLVRYADTVGFHGDQEHHISPYRDYVIKSFNENLPFDEFTREQLAGDLLPKPTMWQRIATGYNRLLQTTHEGGAQDKEYRAKYSADRVRNLTGVWLGATVGCAECHDHKFDPYTQRDFYGLAAFFADIEERGAYRGPDASPTLRPPEIPAWNIEQSVRIEQLDRVLAGLPQPGVGLPFELAHGLAAIRSPYEREKAAIKKKFAPTMVTVTTAPRTIRILGRGDWMDESGPEVAPAVPHFLPSVETNGRATRNDLVRWLVSRANPLTARVAVNRLWKQFFGAGLSRRLDDLGAQGEPPTHPELLDWLAVEFIESGWDIKHMVRLIVTSQAYQQSSAPTPEMLRIDPENRLLARQSRWRLQAETVRDYALATSGLLTMRLGGPSARPYQPEGYYQHLNFPPRKYRPDNNAGQHRRGVYMHWQRAMLHPMLKSFDAPSREDCTAERSSSNTPLAALVLLNDPSFVETARGLAQRIVNENNGDAGSRQGERPGVSRLLRPDVRSKAAWAFRQVLLRSPTDGELDALLKLYEHDRQEYVRDPKAAEKLLAVGIAPAVPNADNVELAAWTSVARALFNLHETITRN